MPAWLRPRDCATASLLRVWRKKSRCQLFKDGLATPGWKPLRFIWKYRATRSGNWRNGYGKMAADRSSFPISKLFDLGPQSLHLSIQVLNNSGEDMKTRASHCDCRGSIPVLIGGVLEMAICRLKSLFSFAIHNSPNDASRAAG